LPPGFRFHPTDEELITFYLASKVFKNTCFNNVKFAEVDLNRCEPWELPGTYQHQKETIVSSNTAYLVNVMFLIK
jgi:hypothetical protein